MVVAREEGELRRGPKDAEKALEVMVMTLSIGGARTCDLPRPSAPCVSVGETAHGRRRVARDRVRFSRCVEDVTRDWNGVAQEQVQCQDGRGDRHANGEKDRRRLAAL